MHGSLLRAPERAFITWDSMMSLTIGLSAVVPMTPVAAANFVTRPSTPKFRVGLAHGDGNVNASDADFKYYRIVIEDSSGDLLGYQAQTVNGGRTYRNKVIVFGVVGEDDGAGGLMVADDLTISR